MWNTPYIMDFMVENVPSGFEVWEDESDLFFVIPTIMP
jgi:hypothetical protein